jgi:outer membrane protein assembly factor BamE
MRLLAVLLVLLALPACSIIYKLPTRQGNVIEQKQLDQLQVGMTRDQVRFLMGTPIAASPFRDDRWDYLGYYKSPRGKVSDRVVSLYFDANTLTRMDGIKLADAEGDIESPDVKTVIENEKKSKNEASREESEKNKDSGVVITPPK